MVLLWKENKKFILELVLANTYKPNDLVDILVLVNVEELLKAECPQKYFGSEDKESWEDCWENTELLRKLIVLFIINSTLPQKVTNSKTEQFLLKQSLNKKARKSKIKNFKINKKLEDKRINKEEKKELKSKKDCD